MSDLKPCPFCGSNIVELNSFLPWALFYWIECGRCGASGGRCQTVDKAVDAWNRRTV